MTIRLCTAALILTTAPYLRSARSAEDAIRPQGLWSAILRSHAFAFKGAANPGAELGNREVARLPTGAQSALRLMRSSQSQLNPDVRTIAERGTEEQFAERSRALAEREQAEDRRAAQIEQGRDLEREVGHLESQVRDAADNLRTSEAGLERAQADLTRQEKSYYCSFGSFVCHWATSPERYNQESLKSATENLRQALEDRQKKLADVRARHDALRGLIGDPQTIEVKRAQVRADGEALTGFYRAAPTPGCRHRLAFHGRPDVRLRESPILNGPASEEDVDFKSTTIYACLDPKQRLSGVEIVDDHGERLASSDVGRDSKGRLTHVRIYDRARTLLEDHHYTADTVGYDVTFRGDQGLVRAILTAP